MQLKVFEFAAHKTGLSQTCANLLDGNFCDNAAPSLLDATKLLREIFNSGFGLSLRPKPKGKQALLAAKFSYDGQGGGPR